MRVSIIVAILSVVSALSSHPARSQNETTTLSIPDKKLDAAANARKRVRELQKKFDHKLAKSSLADQHRVLDEAQNAARKAVTDQGLSVEEYWKILEIAQNDPSLHERLLERLRAAAE